ncbi:TraB/GumN family protein [Chryseobacterium aahli]|uniref:TraB/GumN family protein n=1 Tax=Chryseobacterium aahli TaxID=1278643 RepID=UPI001F60C832|nr:TraB/GumN family protein [Chryseobacterium aahli]MCI3936758.1 TraB/GumN family protein [Chryseobacterium aahli]
MKKIFLLSLLFQIFYASAQNTILWTIKKEGNPHTSYLLGTYHQMGNSYVDSLKSVTRALQSSQLAIFENIDTGENLIKLLNSRTENFSYKEKLSKKYLKDLEEIAKNWAVPVSKLSPPELRLKLEQVYYETQCGTIKPTDTSTVFDNYLIKIAQNNSVQVLGLESNDLMTSYINQTDRTEWKDVKKEIYTWVDNIKLKRETKTLCSMAEAYKKQKLDYQLDSECAETVIISSRNAVWLPIIEKNIAEKNSFIAVGYAHLTGKCGLVTQLRKTGYKVEPVYDLSK